MSVPDLRSARRSRRLTPARQACAWAFRQAGYTYDEIGLILRRDHTTIIYAVRQAEQRAAANAAYAAQLRAVVGEPPAVASQLDARPIPPSARLYLAFGGVLAPRVA